MSSSSLFSLVRLGDLRLENRIFLPPLTRCRSTQPGDIANVLMADYYAQRTQAGFLITEGTQIEPRGQGYAWTPGIYSPGQIAGWKCVTDAVHAKRRPIFAQLWHVGRVSHRVLQPGHEAPVAPSAVAATGVNVFIPTGPGTGKLVPPDMPRALSVPEIHDLVELYAHAARNALAAGFDGVEIHAANGYLINQFISERANFRTDAYGGSLSNRLRFLREVVEAVSAVVTPDRMGVRFSPLFGIPTEERVYLGLLEGNPQETYTQAVRVLAEAGVAYVSLAEADWDNAPEMPDAFRAGVRDIFGGRILYAGRYDLHRAQQALAHGWADMIGFGRKFIANPDLPARLEHGWPLNPLDPATMYGGGAHGYTDYPFHTE
ncbi:MULTISPECIES: alkene reductase [Acetobacter]|jgi:N-ethylmaleimide reductase|uniref:N-ethylmaleimide reductase n=1 Tax=Acetobacter lovaniensis TaxID=104100 RepID=A0A841QHB3_9PROT|nr:alkene reductase [Acetobacter lovaniensis]MBB6457725.1 N-ethylmaleimide reductase [Acetobacter lovaniensis]MCP1239933.1 alkene reductase [Acetobacter lovaniensis]NHN82033.1 alkene reductase [Acetobacter lovaniensis]